MSDEEKPMDLRDKFAIEIINAMIAGDPSWQKSNESTGYGSAYGASQHTGLSEYLTSYFTDDESKWKDSAIAKMEKIARTAYKMADIIRKIRLESFT